MRDRRATRRRSGRRGAADQKKKTFGRKDFSSGDGFVTSTWGPALWHVLHTISFNYPVAPSAEDKQNYRAFLEGLRHVLPCGKCRANLTVNLKELPLEDKHLENRDAFSRYLYALHNKVNRMLSKPNYMTYPDIRERYEHFRSRCTANEAKRVLGDATAPPPPVKPAHKGCTEPLYGKKSKCILHIVPDDANAGPSLQIDAGCIKRRCRTHTSA